MDKIIVDCSGDGDYKSIQEAIDSVSGNVCIYIKNGVYKEKLIINKPYITILGEDKEKTVLTYNDGALALDETGKPMGTFKTASVHVLREAEGFRAENITIENSAGMGDVVGQAVALYLDCDKAVIKNCRLIARQDTLLTAPMHEDITREPDILNRQYFEDCYIEGDVDFIFGGAVAVFKNCIIFSLDRNMDINGYVTAACTSKSMKFGYVFFNCDFKSDAREGSVYLGRPWREFAKTVFIDCNMDEHINKESFSKWKGFEQRSETCFYAQYNSKGKGFDKNTVAPWTYILNEEDIKKYTVDNIFEGWKPF